MKHFTQGSKCYCQTYLLKSLPTHSEWQCTVWKAKDMPRHKMAPRKNAANTSFSCNWISMEGLVRKYVATPMNATHPATVKSCYYTPFYVFITNHAPCLWENSWTNSKLNDLIASTCQLLFESVGKYWPAQDIQTGTHSLYKSLNARIVLVYNIYHCGREHIAQLYW